MMQTVENSDLPVIVSCPTLPLAVYREMAAHLRQVPGVEVTLLPQRSPDFDYTLSQIGGLQLQVAPDLPATHRSRVQQILAYYSDRYDDWETV